ncbi:MAG: bifunctional demethylmenaquinone methyltransferase/2-methoxy-6-polyprenyl-1,4-benzoquinol methylase UbiE [Bacteroidota bacterium]
MFNSIASRYDFLNRALSMGIDKGWRTKAIRSLSDIQPKYILDVATGTADLAIEALKLNPVKVTGVDISAQMLRVGEEKILAKNLTDKIELVKGDSEQLLFADNTFDAITVAFGVRNFEHLQKGIDEMYRVLRPGGKIAVLEFSKPKAFPFKQIYNFYFNTILPTWGGLISKNKNAYAYLPESVQHFPEGNEFIAYLNRAGFKEAKSDTLTFGICSLYTAIK